MKLMNAVPCALLKKAGIGCLRPDPGRCVIVYVKGDADENGQMIQLSQRPSVSILKIHFYLLFMIEIYL